MSQPKLYVSQLHITTTHGERALLDYYAWRYGKERAEVVRTMVRRYVDADKRFDPDEFLKFVKEHVLPDETDASVREQLREQTATIAHARKRSGKPS